MPLTITKDPRDVLTSELFNGLGEFWTRIYKDRTFILNLCKGDSMIAAQTYLNLLETLACLGRSSVPVYHREHWFPIVLRASEVNTGDSVKLYLGIKPPVVLGPQPEDTAYTKDQEFNLGGNALKHGFVSYPAHADNFHAGMLTICSGIINPKATYLKDVDYYVDRSSVIFKSELNPFNFPSKFPARTVVNASGLPDLEIVLWASDVLIDRNYVPDHFGYLQSVVFPDPEYGARATDAILELRSSGTSLELLRKNLGRLFATAVVESDAEVVQDIYTSSSGDGYVITDKRSYGFRAEETLNPEIVKGAVVNQGDFLTTTLRFYAKLNPDRFLPATGHTLEQFIQDIPRLTLSKGVLSADGFPSGITVEWAELPLIYNGRDANKNPKLSFKVSALQETSDAYWAQVWQRCESQGVNMAEMLAAYMFGDVSFTEGLAVGKINPMKFVMKNCLNSNTSALVVDFNAIPGYIRSLNLLYEINKVTAAYSLVFLIAKKSITEETYDLGSQKETLNVYAGRRLSETAGVAESLTYMEFKPIYRRVPR